MRKVWKRFLTWLFSENKELTNKEMARFIVDKAESDLCKDRRKQDE